MIVNSHSIPTELLEDNLFGHSRGEFTGAASAKIGLLEVADRGTVLFDEISTVTPEVQTKLLRVIQDKEFLPLGALENRTVDVRIIAATNEDLKRLIEIGRFREDLYYRLRDQRVHPAARLEETSRSWGALSRSSTPVPEGDAGHLEAADRFFSYTWPGNVWELENVVERGSSWPAGRSTSICSTDSRSASLEPRPPEGPPLTPSAVGAATIEGARRTGGAQKHAAELLGLKPTTLKEDQTPGDLGLARFPQGAEQIPRKPGGEGPGPVQLTSLRRHRSVG
jgi:transcriptional regulator with GAF, ATPase, and Fis domain